MSPVCTTSGLLDGQGRRFAIVASRFNGRLVDRLVEGALDCLERHGVAREAIHLVRVPGAWEIPQALEELASKGGVDALIALGVVIRGETPHFDYVAGGAVNGAAAVAARHRVPVALGILTCNTSQEAEERSGGKAGNKGWDAALAAIEMADLFLRLRATS
ncbi:MAG: 6,7-dimethyl-8-ribityllumazine synthase [Thermoanaerobaculia bacterium]